MHEFSTLDLAEARSKPIYDHSFREIIVIRISLRALNATSYTYYYLRGRKQIVKVQKKVIKNNNE